MFEWLFKYPVETFQQSTLILARGWSAWLLFAAIALSLIVIVWSWTAGRSAGKVPATQWMGLGLLQWLFVAVGLFMFWQPALQLRSTHPGDNAIGLLIDNSQSMWSANDGSVLAPDSSTRVLATDSRLGSVLEGLEAGGVVALLQARFRLLIEQFGSSERRVEVASLDELKTANAGKQTALLQALGGALDNASEQSMAGLILVSDGGHNASEVDSDWWQELAANNVPVYPIAAGSKHLVADLELEQITVSADAISGSYVPVTLSIVYDLPRDGGAVAGDVSYLTTARVYNGEVLLQVEDIVLQTGVSRLTHTTGFIAPEGSVLDLRVELDSSIRRLEPALQEEKIVARDVRLDNNVRNRVVSLGARAQRILYIEGEPRWEYKFIRRALHDFRGVELISLLRTSPNKLYRQGVKDAKELSDGFPETREELFRYDALIIGSLEAAYLNAGQQRNIRDFVSERGGTLLMLAGKNGLTDGGWGRTAIAQALPASLDAVTPSFARNRRVTSRTLLGQQSRWLELPHVDDEQLQDWTVLPALADYQQLGATKPGASVLLQATHEATGASDPLLLWQRYGRGKSYVLATSGTWRWQMGLPADDMKHETFWQGLLGNLVDGVLPRISLALDRHEYFDVEQARLTVDVRDSDFEPAGRENLHATVVQPDGSEVGIDLQQDPSIAGRFTATVAVPATGTYHISVSQGDSADLQRSIWFTRDDERAEAFGLRRNDALLNRIAAVTGGEVITEDDLQRLPQLLGEKSNLLVRHSELPLWNMPVLFLLMLCAKVIEWLLRWRAGRL